MRFSGESIYLGDAMPDKAIFLDRDDTIIEDSGYISRAEQVKLIPAAAAALVELRKMGYKLIVVTNQSGLARGFFTEQTLTQVHEKLKLLLSEQNAYLDRIYYCPYLADGVVAKYRKDSDWRKPKPGMLLAASKEMKIDLKNSWMIGNDYKDITAGKSAGCKTILVKSYIKTIIKKTGDPTPDFEAINLREAVNIIKRENTPKLVVSAPKPVEEKNITAEAKPVTEKIIIEEKLIEEEKPVVVEPVIEIPPQETQTIKTSEPVEQKIEQEQEQKPEPRLEPKKEQLVFTESGSKTEYLLEEIKLLLQSRTRNEQFSEFSAMKLMAGVLQALVLFCVVVGIWYKLSPTGKDSAVFAAIGFAIVLQLMSLTLFIMHKDK